MNRQLEQASTFIRHLADINVVLTLPEDFEKRFPFFMPELQPNWIPRIRRHLSGLDKPFVIHFSGLLHANYTLLGYQEYYVILGPYRMKNIRQFEASDILEAGHHSIKWLPVFLSNYRSLPLKSIDTIQNIIRTFLIALDGNAEYTEKDIHLAAESSIVSEKTPELVLQSAARVVNNYDNERTYMNYIRLGDTAKALEAEKALYEPHERLIPDPSREQLVAGFAIFRTVTRIAARDTGLTPPVLDAISRYYQNLFEKDPTNEKMAELRHSLVLAVCSAIHAQNGMQYSPAVQQSISYIRRNLSSHISVSQIAKDIGISPNRLSARFHKETSQTLTEYITLQRLLSAADLLAMTSLPVQEISEKVGIASSAYFSRLFKEHYGLSPSDYRKGYPVAEP